MSDKVKVIEERINLMQELEEQLTTAGPAKSETIFRKQSVIQENYYGDTSDLIEIIDSQSKEIDALRRQLTDEACKNSKNELYRTQLELAVKALKEEMERAITWEDHGTFKRIRATIAEINRLSEGSETPSKD